MNLNDKLRKIRTEHGYTQQKIADYLEIERSTYAYYETGTTKPSILSLQKLSQLYGISLDALIATDGNENLLVASPQLSEADCVPFSRDEAEIIRIFRELSDEKKSAFLTFIKTFRN